MDLSINSVGSVACTEYYTKLEYLVIASKKELSILKRPLTKLSSTLAEILYTAKETIRYSFGKPDIRLKEAIYC